MIGDPVALRIRQKIERAPKRLINEFGKVQTSFIADSQQGWNCLHHSIKPIFNGMKFSGSAITATNGPRDNLAAMAMLDFVKPGDVLMIATGEDESGAVIGDHFAAAAKSKGVVGIVTDGLVRDQEGIIKLGPPTFSRGASPNAGYRNGPGEVNTKISLGGVVINPGDIVVGDNDGVVVIPFCQAEEIKKALDLVIAAERKTEKAIRAG